MTRLPRPPPADPHAIDPSSPLLFPLPLMVVVALLTAVNVELVRATGPLLEIALDVSVLTAAGSATLAYAGAAISGLALVRVASRAGDATMVLVGVVALAVARLVLQGLTATARVAVGLATTSLAIAVLTIAVAVLAGRDSGGRAAAVSIAVGAASSVGVQLALGTWDAIWRHDWLGWGITSFALVCLVAAGWLAHRDPATAAHHRVRRVWMLGPTLSLLVMVMANSGFAASQSSVRLAIAAPVAAVGLLLAGTAVAVAGSVTTGMRTPSRVVAPAVALAPAAATVGVFWAEGPLVLVFLVVSQVSAFVAIGFALDRGESHLPITSGRARDGATAALVGLGTILPLFAFQLDYTIPLGFPNELVIVAAAALFGAATLPRSHARTPVSPASALVQEPVVRPSMLLLAAAAAVALIGSALAIGRELSTDPSADPTATAAGPLTLVSWNLHYGVDPDAGVDLEEIARWIEEQDPSIVTLQEVSRGWMLGGGTDMATWLAQRLDMRVAYAPAADRQFGNAVLTNLPTTRRTAVELPYGEGPQERSAIAVDIDLPDGPLRVASVHLQNKSQHIATRLDQIEQLLEAHADVSRLIVGGDFNAQPGSPEIDAMTGIGLVSAQDASGDPSALTDPSVNPEKRIDWVFGRGVTFADTVVLADALSSDHLPLVVRFSPISRSTQRTNTPDSVPPAGRVTAASVIPEDDVPRSWAW